MDRRVFLATTAAAPLISRLSLGANRAEAAEPAPTLGWRQFEVTTRVTLQSAPGQSATGPAQLWLPLAQTAGGYQTVLELRWQGNGRADLVRDQKYGAAIVRGAKAGARARFFLAPIRPVGFFALCAAASLAFRAEPSRAGSSAA